MNRAVAWRPDTPVISCAKGIERGTRKFMTQIIAEATPRAIPAILSGPSFADDVARGLPTAVTLAAADETVAADLAQALGSATFRPYHSTDLRGVEMAARRKMCSRSQPASCRAAAWAQARRQRWSRAASRSWCASGEVGARPETLTGLSGLGDSCSPAPPRNRAIIRSDCLLGKGETYQQA